MNDSISKISSILESVKDLSIEALSTLAPLIDTNGVATDPQEISKLLNSRATRDVSSGMKCVISIISKGGDGLPFFADVVKNITSDNAKVRQLVIIYLTKYADAEADTALLAINSIQKSLGDKTPINRANAIRSLAGIKITSIVPIVTLSLKRCSSDPSPLTRSAAAISIGKIYLEAGKSRKQIYEILGQLLADNDVMVVGSAIKSYYRIRNHLGKKASKKWQFIHGNFRRLCSLITRFDEWAQIYTIDILTEYCRAFISKPIEHKRGDGSKDDDVDDDEQEEYEEEESKSMDQDLHKFLVSIQPLAQSISDAVVISVAKATYLLSPNSFQNFSLQSQLMKIAFSTNTESAIASLWMIAYICEKDPFMFASHFTSFFPFPNEMDEIANVKLDILASVINDVNVKYIFEELKYCACNAEPKIAKKALRKLTSCAISSEWNDHILNWCLYKLGSFSAELAGEAITVIRYILQQKYDVTTTTQEKQITNTITRLAILLEDGKREIEDDAKASLIWTIGEYSLASENSVGPDVLRKLLKSFAKQSEVVRYQLLVLAAKVYAFELIRQANEMESTGEDRTLVNVKLEASIESQMFQHALHLAKYDTSYDIRDRARMLDVLLSSGVDRAQLASLLLQVPKPIPELGSINDGDISLIRSYFAVPKWLEDSSTLPPPSIRNEVAINYNKLSAQPVYAHEGTTRSPSPVVIPSSNLATRQGNQSNEVGQQKLKTYKLQSLDDFFGSDEDEEEEDEEDEDEDEEDEDEEDEDEEEDDSEEDDSEEDDSEEDDSEVEEEEEEEEEEDSEEDSEENETEGRETGERSDSPSFTSVKGSDAERK